MNWSFVLLAKESRVNIKADIKYRFFILTAQTLINEELQHTHWFFSVEAVFSDRADRGEAQHNAWEATC